MPRGHMRRGGLELTVQGDRLTLRHSFDGTAPFMLLAGVGVVLMGVGAAGLLPTGWAVGVGSAGLAVLAIGALGIVLGRVPYTLTRDGWARRGPRPLGRVVGVYVRAAISPDGDRFTLYLRREGRRALAVSSAGRRDLVQDLAIRVASFLDVDWHQGPGEPR